MKSIWFTSIFDKSVSKNKFFNLMTKIDSFCYYWWRYVLTEHSGIYPGIPWVCKHVYYLILKAQIGFLKIYETDFPPLVHCIVRKTEQPNIFLGRICSQTISDFILVKVIMLSIPSLFSTFGLHPVSNLRSLSNWRWPHAAVIIYTSYNSK